MKKVLYSLLIFFSVFVVVDKVSAATYNFPVMDYFYNYYDETDNLQEDFEEILSIAKGKDYDVIITLYHYVSPSGTSSLYCDTHPTEGMCKYIAYYYVYIIQNGHVPTFKINSSSWIYSLADSNIVSKKIEVDSDYNSNYEALITELTNNDFSNFVAATTNKLYYYARSNNNEMIYGASGDYVISSLDSSSNSYYFGEHQIVAGSLLPTYKNYYYVEEEPEPYIFDEYIEDHIYSKMIFNFDLSILESRDYVFDLLLNNLSVENEINDGILYETEMFEISYPYLEYETSTGLKDILYLKDYDDNAIKEKRKVFVGFYQERLPEDVTSLKLIIPLYDTTEYQLLVQLVSWFPFEVSYETEEEMYSYYEYLDLSNKYGVMFIPKLLDNNSQVTAYFLTRGIDTIYVYDTYDYKEQPIEIYNDVSDFTYSFSYYQTQYNLFFKTRTYSSSSTIYYDTRYFTYEIVDSKYLIGNVINPNSGENHYIDFSNTANISIDFKSIGDVFYFISEKIDSGGEAYYLFKDSVSTFFNTMPTDIYILILTILSVILIGTALALGGWK